MTARRTTKSTGTPKKKATRRSTRPRKPHKWTHIDQAAAAEKLISPPGVVYSLATSELPGALQRMPGLVSYFVSGYITPVSVAPGITAGAEAVVVRTDGSLAKAYNFVFATSSNGQVCFTGPYKDFPEHHFAPGTAMPVESLFGHGPFRKP
jgi:hypothetical protein